MNTLNAVVAVLRDNAVIVSLIVGSITPLLTSIVQQPTLSTRTRKIVATGISIAVGVAVAAATGVLEVPSDLGDFTRIAAVIGGVWTAAEAFYQKLWQPAGINKLEQATSPWVKPEVEYAWDDEPEFETK